MFKAPLLQLRKDGLVVEVLACDSGDLDLICCFAADFVCDLRFSVPPFPVF